ncbi:C4-dicarboxylate TRAP transporter large permease protein DctM [subsurface metagenome]
MSIEMITLLMIVSVLVLLALGLPMCFALGGVAIVSAFFLWSPEAASRVLIVTAWGLMGKFVIVAVPLFIFMGLVLQTSGIADNLYEMMYRWLCPIRGGLAMGTVFICTAFAAMVGISGAATISMGVIALPSMLKRGYDKRMVTGCIQAGGALGFLIPPSVMMIVYAMIARESVGGLFAGGIFPGLLLSTLFCIYIGIRSILQPHLAPSVPREERYSWKEKISSLKAVVLPICLIIAVLGSIFAGMATPSEAAGIGAAGSLVCAAVGRRLNMSVFKAAIFRTARLTAMVMFIGVGALTFSAVYCGLGATELIKHMLATLGLSPWGTLILMQLSFFVLGAFLDDWAILFICIPIYLPIIIHLGFDPLWFGVLFIINMQMAYLTPPFGYNLFYMKGVVPKEITMADIYRSIIPFVILQATGLALVMIFPQIVLWLPSVIFG